MLEGYAVVLTRLRAAARKILGREDESAALLSYEHLNECKRAMIDFAFKELAAKSFADLGAVWAVEGGYTFYTMHKHAPKRGVLVDWRITEAVRAQASDHPELELIEANFGSGEVAEEVGKVDAVFLFDVLLHQVKPDWDEVLKMYAERAECLLVFNQQYTNFEKTTRLIELGETEYFQNVQEDPQQPHYRNAFDRPDAIEPVQNRAYRDQYGIWQWAITDHDLLVVMSDLGFEPVFMRNCGQYGDMPQIENHAFIFARKKG